MDTAITKVVQANSNVDATRIEHFLRQFGIWSEFVPNTSMAQYQFLFDIDGNANSWGLFEKLLMGACVIKVESSWEEWYYKDLKPWVHYVPVAADLADLAERVKWCLAHQEECERIAARGQKLANGLEFDAEMRKMADVLVTETLEEQLADSPRNISAGSTDLSGLVTSIIIDESRRPYDRLTVEECKYPEPFFANERLVEATFPGSGVSRTNRNPMNSNPLIAKVKTALQIAIAGGGKLPAEILALEGMSGRKYRLFINNLIEAIGDARYLEVGVWMGSTLCSAIHGNTVSAVAIDNWSQFGGPMSQFLMNLSRFKTADANVSFLERDFRAVDFSSLGRFNVYLFDGPHDLQDQQDGLRLALPALDENCVLIVDDWNWANVRNGTLAAIRDIGMTIDYMVEIRTTLDDSHALASGAQSDWHNGYLLAVVSKTPSSPEARPMIDIAKAFLRIGVDKNYTELDFDGMKVDLQGWNSTHPIFERVFDMCKPRTIIEVGTWKGASTVHMLKLADRLALDVQIICIDTWTGSNEVLWTNDELRPLLNLRYGYPNLFLQFIFNMVELNLIDHVFPLPLTSTAASRLLKGMGVFADIIYIDAGHSEEEVYADLVMYYDLLRPGGAMVGDDYHQTWPGVVAAVNRFIFEQKLIIVTEGAKFMLMKGG